MAHGMHATGAKHSAGDEMERAQRDGSIVPPRKRKRDKKNSCLSKLISTTQENRPPVYTFILLKLFLGILLVRILKQTELNTPL